MATSAMKPNQGLPESQAWPGKKAGRWKRLYNQLHRVIDDLYLCCELEGHSAWATAVVYLLKDAAHDFNDLAIQLSALSRAKAKAPVAWQVRAHRHGSRSPRNHTLPDAEDEEGDDASDQERGAAGAGVSKTADNAAPASPASPARRIAPHASAAAQQHARLDLDAGDMQAGSQQRAGSASEAVCTPTKTTHTSRLSRVEYAQQPGTGSGITTSGGDDTSEHTHTQPASPARSPAADVQAVCDVDDGENHGAPHTHVLRHLTSRASLEILSSGVFAGQAFDTQEEQGEVVGESGTGGADSAADDRQVVGEEAATTTKPSKTPPLVPALVLDGTSSQPSSAPGSKAGSRRGGTGRERGEDGSTPPCSPQGAAQGVLLSPGRRRTPQENKQASEEKQARAERTRLAAHQQRVEAILTRVAVKDARSRELRERHLAAVVHKAGDETRKVAEVAFINQMLEEDKKLSLQQKLEEGEARRREILEEKLSRQKEAAAAAELAVERRRAAECARQAELAEKARRKEAAQAAWAATKEEERRAQAAAREAAKAAQERLARKLAMAAQHEATARVLRIEQRLKEAASRRAERLSTIRDRAAMGALPGVTTLTSPASQTSLCGEPGLLDADVDAAAGGGGVAVGGGGGGVGGVRVTASTPPSPQASKAPRRDTPDSSSAKQLPKLPAAAAISTPTDAAPVVQVTTVSSPPGMSSQARLAGNALGARGAAAAVLPSPTRSQPLVRPSSSSGAVQSLSTISTVLSGAEGGAGGGGVRLTSGGGQVTGATCVRNRLKGLRRRAAKMLLRIESDKLTDLELPETCRTLLATGPGAALLNRWTQLVISCPTTTTTSQVQQPRKQNTTCAASQSQGHPSATASEEAGIVTGVAGAGFGGAGVAATGCVLAGGQEVTRGCSLASSRHVVISAVAADLGQPALHDICMAAAGPSGMLSWLAQEVGQSCDLKLSVWDPAPLAAQLLLQLVQAPVNATSLLAGGQVVGLVRGAMCALDRANSTEAAAAHSMESDAQVRELACLSCVLQTLSIVVQPVGQEVGQGICAHTCHSALEGQLSLPQAPQQEATQQEATAVSHQQQQQQQEGAVGAGQPRQDVQQATSSSVASHQVHSKLLLMREHLVGFITASGIVHRLSELFVLCDQPMLWRSSTEPSTPASLPPPTDDKLLGQPPAVPVETTASCTGNAETLSSPADNGRSHPDLHDSETTSGTLPALLSVSGQETVACSAGPGGVTPQPASALDAHHSCGPEAQGELSSCARMTTSGAPGVSKSELRVEQPPAVSRDTSQSGVAALPAIPQHVVHGLHLLEVLTERPTHTTTTTVSHPPPRTTTTTTTTTTPLPLTVPGGRSPGAHVASSQAHVASSQAPPHHAQEPQLMISKRWSHQTENAASLSLTFQETAMAGLPMLLTAVLLHAAPSCTPSEARPEALPENFAEAALSVVRILNNVARLDLPALQSGLASSSHCLGVTHLLAFLISYSTNLWPGQLTTATMEAALRLGCTPAACMCHHPHQDLQQQYQGQPAGGGLLTSSVATVALLNEVLLLIGYLTLLDASNQGVLTWGRPPDSVLHRLMTLPPAYFSHASLSQVLLPSLAAVCYKNPRLREVIQAWLPPAQLAAAVRHPVPLQQVTCAQPGAADVLASSSSGGIAAAQGPATGDVDDDGGESSQPTTQQVTPEDLPRRYHLSQRIPVELLSQMEQYFSS